MREWKEGGEEAGEILRDLRGQRETLGKEEGEENGNERRKDNGTSADKGKLLHMQKKLSKKH